MRLTTLASSSHDGPRRGIAWWMFALVVLLAIAVYANSLKNDYAYDDVGIVKNNVHVVDLQWTTIWTDNYWPKVEGVNPDALYRPLTLWSYLANQAIAPDVAWPFHLVNILLHALVSLLVTLLAWRILGDRVIALVAGVIFAVHPLHTEVVANIVGRAELLAAVWSLLMLVVYLPLRPIAQAPAPIVTAKIPLIQLAVITLATITGMLAYSKGAADPTIAAIQGSIVGMGAGLFAALFIGCITRKSVQPQGLRAWWHGGLVALCFAAALLSKETPATLTFAVVFIDLWRFIRWSKGGRPLIWAWFSSQAVRYYVPLAFVVACYTRARINTGGLMSRVEMVHRVVNPLVEATPIQRIVTPFMLLAKYILLTLWPAHLSADYSAPSLLPTANPLTGNAFQPPAIFGILVCILLITLSIRFWKKRPQLLLLAGLAFFSYMLVANVVRIGTIFGERLFYWPSVFALIVIAWAGVSVARRASIAWANRPHPALLRSVSAALLVAAVGAMSFRTFYRNTDWSDNVSLAISTARDNPDSGKACSWAGSILVNADNTTYQQFGLSLIERAIDITPDYVSARWELAKFYGLRGDMGPSAVCIAEAARQDPGSQMTRTAIPALIKDLRKADPATYTPYIEKFQKEHPADEAAYLALAFADHAQGKWDLAEKMAYKALDTAIPKRADKADIYHEAGAELAAIRFDRGDVEQAVITMRKYTTNMHNSVEARCSFAAMLLALDPKKNPDAVKEAEFNLDVANIITPNSARVREVRGQLARFKLAVARGEPLPADIPSPRVTIAAEPKSEVLP